MIRVLLGSWKCENKDLPGLNFPISLVLVLLVLNKWITTLLLRNCENWAIRAKASSHEIFLSLSSFVCAPSKSTFKFLSPQVSKGKDWELFKNQQP